MSTHAASTASRSGSSWEAGGSCATSVRTCSGCLATRASALTAPPLLAKMSTGPPPELRSRSPHADGKTGLHVGRDDLLDHRRQIGPDDARPVAERAEHHPGTGDEGRLASGAECPGYVPVVRGDQPHIADADTAPVRDRVVGLRRGLEMPH